MASRHLARSIVLQSLFEWDFYLNVKSFGIGGHRGKPDLVQLVERNIKRFGGDFDEEDFAKSLAEGVSEHLKKIDRVIQESASERSISQLSIVDRNILRLGMYELLYEDKKAVPPKVAINEAIELAKNFGSESSGRFINGVLGTVYKQLKPEKEVPKVKMEIAGEEVLSGGLVYRKENSKFQVALIYDIFGYWTFPKGHVEEGENLEQTALREIKEEIGLTDLRIIKKMGEREYIAKEPQKGFIKKKVTDFLLKSTGDTRLKVEDSEGIKDAKWFGLEDVLNLRVYKETKETLKKAIDYLRKKS